MNILEVKNLNIGFNMYDKLLNQKLHQMVFDLNVTIKKGEILAIAGSSGSGKSLMAHAILGILPKNAVVSAEIKFKAKNFTIFSSISSFSFNYFNMGRIYG